MQNGTAVARLLGEPPQMRTGRVTLGAPGEDGCFAVVYEASGVAAEERGTLPAHDVFRYAVELSGHRRPTLRPEGTIAALREAPKT